MALVKCHECGGSVSTEAKACPQCGVKPKKSHAIKLFLVLLSLIALLVIAGRFIPDTEERSTPSAEADAPIVYAPPPPSHNYVWSGAGRFGYQRELSDDDRRHGNATAPLFVIFYQGYRYGGYDFASVDGGVTTLFRCTEPCDVVEASGTLGPRVIPAPRGSLLWAVIEDARHGDLGGTRPPMLTKPAGEASNPSE